MSRELLAARTCISGRGCRPGDLEAQGRQALLKSAAVVRACGALAGSISGLHPVEDPVEFRHRFLNVGPSLSETLLELSAELCVRAVNRQYLFRVASQTEGVVVHGVRHGLRPSRTGKLLRLQLANSLGHLLDEHVASRHVWIVNLRDKH